MSPETRQTVIKIAGRKIQGYPSLTFTVEFSDVDDFVKKVDNLINGTDYGKVDVYIDHPEVFTPDEKGRLENEWFIF